MEKEEIKKILQAFWEDAKNGKDFEKCSLVIIELFYVLSKKY